VRPEVLVGRPVVLCILDGVGRGRGEDDDAVATARTPVLDGLMATCPWRELQAHGTAVGLPSDDDMGNSEVGHNAMGAGRVFDQGAKLVDKALRDGSAFETDVWKQLVSGGTLHLMGLCSDGNVHSHVDHLHLLLDRAEADGVERIRLHLLTDGRDVSARSALTWIEPLEERLAAARERGLDQRIASGGGRMHITMDRYEADWPMVERGYRCHVLGEGTAVESASAAIRQAYEASDVDDQYLPAFVVHEEGQPVGRMADGDTVLFFNFRGDRALEISRVLGDPDFDVFDVSLRPDLTFAGMMEYDGDLKIPTNYLVAPPAIDSVVGEHLVAAGKRTFAVSETQKFGHVTFFFNGNRSGRLDEELETYLEIPSDLATPDTRPWMKAAEITDAVVEALAEGGYDHIRLNLANGDMVGHTGDLEATRIALEAVDLCVGRIVDAVRKAGGVLLVTADHGNADEMVQRKKGAIVRDDDGAPLKKTSHTLNPVPFIVFDPTGKASLTDVPEAGLASIGATVLELCGVEPPADYLPGLVRA
jgi:2,3-bisphosphoglycerate-independent phosphoglycerate mutase